MALHKPKPEKPPEPPRGRASAFPELVDETTPDALDWQVTIGQPATDLERHRQSIPVYDEAISRAAKIHENLHVRYTPRGERYQRELIEAAGGSMLLAQSCEDAVLHGLLHITAHDTETYTAMYNGNAAVMAKPEFARHLFDLHRLARDPKQFTELVTGATLANFALGADSVPAALQRLAVTADERAAAKRARDVQRAVSPVLSEWWGKELARLQSDAYRSSHSGISAKRLARMVANAAAKHAEREREAMAEAEAAREAIAKLTKPGGMPRSGKLPFPVSGGKGRWIDPKVFRPHLTKRIETRKFYGRRARLVDEGATVAAPWRMEPMGDGKVFRKLRSMPLPIGVVLVDLSGSMSWSDGDLERVLDESPAAFVAGYSGGWLRKSADTSECVEPLTASAAFIVFADRGMRVASVTHAIHAARTHGQGANFCDVPAMRLAARLGPNRGARLWVSDGQATQAPVGGTSEVYGDGIYRLAAKVASHLGYQRVNDSDDLRRRLEQLR